MKISIITATYNSGSTVRDTIESVLNQTYKDIEYIIVDGVSKDNTRDIVCEYEPRFEGKMRIISEPDKGIYDAMNKGIAMATGDVVGILNSDDFYTNNSILAKIVSVFLKTDELEAVFGNLYFVSPEDTNIITREWKGSSYKSFTTGWHPAHPTFYVKKKVFDDFGIFDTSFDISADFELMLRFIEKHKIKSAYIDDYFVKMRLGGASTGNIKNIIIGNINIIRAFRKNGLSVGVLYPIKRLMPKIIKLLKYKLRIK